MIKLTQNLFKCQMREQQKTNYPAAQPGSKQDALQRELKKMKNINLFLLIYKHIATLNGT